MGSQDEERLRWLLAEAEREYDKLYEPRGRPSASEVADLLIEAAQIAERLGRPDQAREIRARMDHIRSTIRSQRV